MPLKKGLHFYLVLGLFAVYLINGLIAIPRNSVTYDEMDHWSYGKRILKGQPQKVYIYDDATAMPISSVNAIPRAVEQVLNSKLSKTDGGLSDIMHGRYMTLLVCLLIGIYIYKWSKELFGEWGGTLSLFLFVFCPNINAHDTLLTTDAYTALFALTTFYYFYKFVKNSGWKYFILFSFSFSIAQVSKYSLLHLFPIFALLSVFILINRKMIFKNWKNNFVRFIVLFVITAGVINIAYLFNGTGKKLEAYNFRSAKFKSFQQIPFISRIPLPLPVPYVEGIDITYHMTELGAGNPLAAGRNYLNGEFRTDRGFWNYYLVMLLYKTPIPYLVIFLLLALLYAKNVKRFSLFSSEFIIGFGLLYYFIFFSFFLSIQSGNRHIILFYPLLYVLAGRLATMNWKKKYKLAGAGILVIYSLVGFYFYFPNLISYTNEFISNKTNAYKIIAEASIDYGQGYYALEKYLAKHPDVKIATSEPQHGKIVIGVNDFIDLYGTGKFEWLKKYKPIGHVNYCYLLFDVPAENK
jgi:hypothetical protein